MYFLALAPQRVKGYFFAFRRMATVRRSTYIRRKAATVHGQSDWGLVVLSQKQE